jgi:hypothetical protein
MVALISDFWKIPALLTLGHEAVPTSTNQMIIIPDTAVSARPRLRQCGGNSLLAAPPFARKICPLKYELQNFPTRRVARSVPHARD